MATNKKRYQVSVTDRMLKQIEEFQIENNIATKSGAVQELIRIGLETLIKEKSERGD